MPLLPLLAFHKQHIAHQGRSAQSVSTASACSSPAPVVLRGDMVARPHRTTPHPVAPASGSDAKPYASKRAAAMGRLFVEQADEVRGNIVFSPYSALAGLAPVYAGAAGQTAHCLGQLLGVPDGVLAADAVMQLGAVNDTLSEMPAGHRALSLWADATRDIDPVYRARMDHVFHCPVRTAAFSQASSRAASRINAWSQEATRGLVPTIVTPHDISASTNGMVLLSSIHVDASWQRRFDREQASTMFTDEIGDTCDVRMLRRTHHDGYHEAPHFSAICVPFKDATMQMEFALPHQGRDWRDALLDDRWMSGKLAWSHQRRIALALPSFEVDSTTELTGALRKAGLTAATDPLTANFENMTGPLDDAPHMYLAGAWQKARITVNAEGTQAAALTAMTRKPLLGLRLAPAVPMRLDRPFLFLMRHMATQEVLFVGKVGLASASIQATPNGLDYLSDDEDSAPEDLACRRGRPTPLRHRFER